MKKITVLLLGFSFLLSTLEISVAIDYCPMKKGYTYSLQDKKSCCCKKANNSNCCKSKKIIFTKINDHYLPTQFSFNAPLLNFTFIEHATTYSKFAPIKKEIVFLQNLRPPKPESLSILYRSILI